MLTASDLPPYSTPGTLPWWRKRRLAPVPCAGRVVATTFIALFLSSFSDPRIATNHDGPWFQSSLLDEQRAHRVSARNARNRLSQQRRARQLPDLAARRRSRIERNRVRHDHLVQH